MLFPYRGSQAPSPHPESFKNETGVAGTYESKLQEFMTMVSLNRPKWDLTMKVWDLMGCVHLL